jgi:hypothetical protein
MVGARAYRYQVHTAVRSGRDARCDRLSALVKVICPELSGQRICG